MLRCNKWYRNKSDLRANSTDLLFLFLQLTELQLTVDGLERERDFYFGKLRDIEVQCQDEGCADLPVVKKIMDSLYATEVGQLKQS